MIRDTEIEPKQANDGADQPLGLAQGQVKHRALLRDKRDEKPYPDCRATACNFNAVAMASAE
jgi:hypothetical protein